MSDNTQLLKAKNNLGLFIQDKNNDVSRLLRPQKHIDWFFKTNDEREKILKKEKKELVKKFPEILGSDGYILPFKEREGKGDFDFETKVGELINAQLEQSIDQEHGVGIHQKLSLSPKGLSHILSSEDMVDLNQNKFNKIYSRLVTIYAQKGKLPWTDYLDNDGNEVIFLRGIPELRVQVKKFISLIKQYLLLAMKEKYKILTLDIIPDSQQTLLAVFTIGYEMKAPEKKEAYDYLKDILNEVFENTFIDSSSKYFNLEMKGLGNQELDLVKQEMGNWFKSKDLLEEENKEIFKERIKKLQKQLNQWKELGGKYPDATVKQFKEGQVMMKNQIEEVKEKRDADILCDEMRTEKFLQYKKHIQNGTFDLETVSEIDYEYDKKMGNNPLLVKHVVGKQVIERFDERLRLQAVFIERDKRERFEVVAERRMQNIENAIGTFENFLGKTNANNYEFEKNDMIKVEQRINEALYRFRDKYEKYFAENRHKDKKKKEKLNKNSIKKLGDENIEKLLNEIDPKKLKELLNQKQKGGD